MIYKNGEIDRTIAWSDIDQLQQGDLGLILHVGKHRKNVSKSCINDETIEFIVEQHAAVRTN